MWKMGGLIIGLVSGVAAATLAGAYLCDARGTLGPLDVAIIGAIVTFSKDGAAAFVEPAQGWWEFCRLRRKLRDLRRELTRPSPEANQRPIPYDELKLAI